MNANYIEELNEGQRAAVLYNEGPSLVIAGAGSGKTRVLTYKIAYLLENGYQPWNILALTFTNKAAREMKERIARQVGDQRARHLWMGTFHSIFLRILHAEAANIGFTSQFTIYDTADSKSLVRSIIKEMGLDEKVYKPGSVQARISNAKNHLVSPAGYASNKEAYEGDCAAKMPAIRDIYHRYWDRCRQADAMDFDDLLFYTFILFRDHPEVLARYQEQFRYILVDEYQDTNKAQFMLVSILASKYGNITVVGDNDQGIYSFRGADITNILNFEKDFPGTKIIKLEQNYRCTGNILKAANAVIKHNENKYEKKLWTANDEGELPSIYQSEDEYDEASYVVKQINHLKTEEYYKYSDFVVLYRMNSQSRAIEDILRREDIPYKIVGGLKFYERKEIKDIIAYLRLIYNTSDNISLKRIINEPKRGIGKTSLDNIQQISEQNGISMYEVIKNAEQFGLNRVKANADDFINLIEELRTKQNELSISELIKETLNKSGYTKALELENSVEAESRIQNLEEFLTVAIEFEEEFADNTLGEFLENITLSSDIDNVEDAENSVTLMTLHSAKGLEFPTVFLVGLEEGIFPGYKSIGEENALQEERRLFYVGITRAKEHLFLTCAKRRTIFGSTSYNAISRFVKEIPEELLNGYDKMQKEKVEDKFENSDYGWKYGNRESKVKTYTFETNSYEVKKQVPATAGFQYRTAESFLSSLNKKDSFDISKYQEGQRVYHKKFGEGTINKVEEEGEDYKIDINFDKVGHKRLMAKFAGLEII